MNTSNNHQTQYVVGLGEALWDCLPKGRQLGGAPANFAFHAGQWGLNAVAVSALGKDALAEETMRQLQANGLTYAMPQVDFPTGTVEVSLDAAGIPSYDIKTGVAWDNIPFTPEIRRIAENCQAVCWGSLAQRNDVSRKTIVAFLDSTPAQCLKVFDINLRQNFYTKGLLQESMLRCNILKINDDELAAVSKLFGLSGDVPQQLIRVYDLDMLILTCGTDGSHVYTLDAHYFQPTPKVQVADTVGAGDSFTGTFVANILNGASVEDAHKRAIDVAAFVCTQHGAMPKLPEAYK